jgi:hypothetical protein
MPLHSWKKKLRAAFLGMGPLSHPWHQLPGCGEQKANKGGSSLFNNESKRRAHAASRLRSRTQPTLSSPLRPRRAARPTAPLFETAVSWVASFAAPARDRAVSASLARNRAMCAARLKDARTWKQKYPPFRLESAKDALGSHVNALRLRQR